MLVIATCVAKRNCLKVAVGKVQKRQQGGLVAQVVLVSGT